MASAQATLKYRFGREGDGGAAATERALALDPDLAEGHARRARELHRAGRRDEAFAELELALRLDPDSYDVNLRAANIYYVDRRFAEAVPYFRKAATLREDLIDPASMLQSACAASGDTAGARRAAEMALERAE